MKIRHRIWARILKTTSRLGIHGWSQKTLLQNANLARPNIPFSYRKREFLESCLPLDFNPKECKKVTACIISSIQEIELLPLSTEAILISQESSIARSFLVAPRDQMKLIERVIPSEFTVIADEDLIDYQLNQFIVQNFPIERQGWIKQQVLKILSTKKLGNEGTLLVDADTILLRPQNWLSKDRVQNLQISIEYHQPYQEHYEKFMLLRSDEKTSRLARTRISFVTHHQLMQAGILDEIFGYDDESFNNGLLKWLSCIDFKKSYSPACEWHTYGTFLATNHPNQIQLTQWRNLGMSRFSESPDLKTKILEMSVPDLIKEFEGWNSLSLHHYIEKT